MSYNGINGKIRQLIDELATIKRGHSGTFISVAFCMS